MKTYVIANQKGGVGKTATSIVLTQFLSRKGKTLAIDLDQQGHLTMGLGGNKETEHGTFEVLTQKIPVTSAIQENKDNPNIHLLPGTINLVQMEREQIDAGIAFRLQEFVLDPLKQSGYHYEYVVIDTPPSLGVLSTIALTVCKEGGVIIPAFTDEFSLDGANELWKTICAAKRYSNPDLKILGILLTRHNPKTVLSRLYTEEIDKAAKMMETKRFKTYIRECVALREATSLGKDLLEYAGKKSHAVIDYQNLIDELLEMDKENQKNE